MSYAEMYLVRTSGLDDSTLVDVLEALACCNNSRTGKCFPSVRTIARIARRSDNVVRAAIARLVDLGYISCEQAPGCIRYFTLHLDRLPKLQGVALPEPLSEVEGVAEVKGVSDLGGDPFQKCKGTPCRSERGPLSEVKAESVMESVIQSVKESGNSHTPAKKKSLAESAPLDALFSIYDQILGGTLPAIREKTATRKSALAARWADAVRQNKLKSEDDGMKFFEGFFQTVAASDFLSGRKPNVSWRASFDWLMKPANFQKVLDGNYTNRSAARSNAPLQFDDAYYENGGVF